MLQHSLLHDPSPLVPLSPAHRVRSSASPHLRSPALNMSSHNVTPSKPADATAEQILEIRGLATELHHAFNNRPRVGTDERNRFDRHFRNITHELIQVLSRARVPLLPRIAMGAIWANNTNILNHRNSGGNDDDVVCMQCCVLEPLLMISSTAPV